jgi:hypothetical protein
MKNKRGQITIGIGAIAIGVLLLAVLIFGIAWFVTANIFLLLGGAIVLLSLIFGLPASIKSPNQLTIGLTITFLFAGVCLMLVPVIADGLGFNIGAGDFVKPLTGTYRCESGYLDDGFDIKYLDQKLLFKCDANVEECEFKIFNQKSGSLILTGLGVQYYECDLNGNNCGTSKTTEIIGGGDDAILPSISNGRSYKFVNPDGLLLKFTPYLKVEQTWEPYALVRHSPTTGTHVVNSESCKLTGLSKSKIFKEDEDIETLYRKGGEGVSFINYVEDWVYGPGTNIVKYNGQEAYCTGGQVFEIVKVEVADGSIKKLNPTYSNPTVGLNGLGKRIAYVECCPSEANCGSDFEFTKLSETEEKECVSDLQCYNAGGFVPLTSTTYVTYKCESGKCVKSEPVKVECTSNSACENGKICDLSTKNYGTCIKQETGEYCGDSICQINENEELCPSDCKEEKLSCEDKNGTWIEGDTIKKGKGPFGIGSLIGLYDEVQEPGKCLISHISILALLILAVGIFIIIFGIIKSMPVALIPGTILTLIGLAWSILAGIGYV